MSVSLMRTGSATTSQCPSPRRPPSIRSFQERSGGSTPRCGSPALLRSAPQPTPVATPQLVTWCGLTPRCTTPSRSSRCEGLAQTPRGTGPLRRQSGVVRGSNASGLQRCTSAGSRLTPEPASPPCPKALVTGGHGYITARSLQCLPRLASGPPCAAWVAQGVECMMPMSPPQLRRSADQSVDDAPQEGYSLRSANSSPLPHMKRLSGRQDTRLDTSSSSSSSHCNFDDRTSGSKAADRDSRSPDSRRPSLFGPPLSSLRSRSHPHVGTHRSSRPLMGGSFVGSARVTPVPSPQMVSEDRGGYLEASIRVSDRCSSPDAVRLTSNVEFAATDEGQSAASSSSATSIDTELLVGKATQPERRQQSDLEVPGSNLLLASRGENSRDNSSTDSVPDSRHKADVVPCPSELVGGKQAERALRRAAELARRAAEAVAKAESVQVSDTIGDSLPSAEEPGLGNSVKRINTNGVVSRNSIGRQAALPQVHEDRSTEFDFSITFLLPQGVEGEEFMETVVLAFPEGHFDVASQCSFVLVPYGGDKTAMVALHRLGPVEALEQARRCGPARVQPKDVEVARNDDQMACWPRKGLPETADEMAARSTAIVYVVHSFYSAEDAEQQLGPICSVEASYRVAAKKHQPRRFIAALHDATDTTGCKAEEMGRSGPLGCEVLKQLQARAVAPLPCSAVTRGSLYRHERLVVQIVEALAAHFRPDRFDDCSREAEQPSAIGTSASVKGGKEKDVCSLVGSETTAGSSLCTTPQTSPPGSLSTTAKSQGQCEP